MEQIRDTGGEPASFQHHHIDIIINLLIIVNSNIIIIFIINVNSDIIITRLLIIVNSDIIVILHIIIICIHLLWFTISWLHLPHSSAPYLIRSPSRIGHCGHSWSRPLSEEEIGR